MANMCKKYSIARRGPQIKAEMDWKVRFPELLGNCHIGNIVGRENAVFDYNSGGRKTITVRGSLLTVSGSAPR
jgi:hypothetical protein